MCTTTIHDIDCGVQVDFGESYTAAERAALKWQYNFYGGFYTALFEAIMRADSDNLARLYRGFPDEVTAYKLYAQGSDWWDDLQEKYRRGGHAL